jgi:hypothetical protein
MPKRSLLAPLIDILSLDNLTQDVNKLCELIKASVQDKKIQEDLERLMIHLAAFRKVLAKNKEYTPEQVLKLADFISELANTIAKKPTPEGVQKMIHEYLAQLNNGKSPVIGEIKVDYKVDHEFNERMDAINAQCKKIDASMRKLQKDLPGHQHTPVEKLFVALHKLTKAVNSFFSMAWSVIKEVEYVAKRAAILTGRRVETAEDKKEKGQRHKAHGEKLLKQAENEEVGQRIRQEQDDRLHRKSDIFSKRTRK